MIANLVTVLADKQPRLSKLSRSDLVQWPAASLGAAQANVGVQGNSGSLRRKRQTTLVTRTGLARLSMSATSNGRLIN
jgi:hypothetical protein